MDVDDFVGLTRRWVVLDALREGPLDRRDLQERVGVSRPTIHRHIRALDEDGLVTKRDGAFVLTPVGELAATEFARVFETMDTVSALSHVVQWLPAEQFDFDFGRLRSATVVVPQATDPFAPARRMLNLVHAADHLRMATYTFLPEGDPTTRQCFIRDDQFFEGVLDSTLIETVLSDPAAAAHLETLLAQGARIAVAAEPVPVIVSVADETVLIGAVDTGGSPQGLIVTDDEKVRAWADGVIDSYLDGASWLTSETVEMRAVATDGGT